MVAGPLSTKEWSVMLTRLLDNVGRKHKRNRCFDQHDEGLSHSNLPTECPSIRPEHKGSYSHANEGR